MGEVYLAEDTKLDRKVAIKVLPREMADDSQRRQRFITEAKAASAINHPNICTIYEVGESVAEQPFIAMEFLEGKTLDQQASLEPATITDIALQIANALDAAHSKGIVHRDIKPSNISINNRGQVKVLDFGLAKQLGVKSTLNADVSTQFQTQQGKVLGTPNYMSPEQALGKAIDQRTDLFSFGVLLYQLATKQLPFSGANASETTNRILNTQPEPIARFNYDIPPELERIILKCMEKKADDRYQSAKELIVDLRLLKRSTETSVVNTTGASRIHQQRKAPIYVALGTLVVFAAIVAGFMWQGPKSSLTDTETKPVHDKYRLAVLPLVNISPNPTADEYFADGMTEELISRLSKLQDLTVIARSSVMQYKGTPIDETKIGQSLRVGTLLTGSVRRDGQQLVITIKLIDVATQGILWSQRYQRELKEVFAVQSEIAQMVASALKVELLESTRERLEKRPTSDMEAFEFYLKGRFEQNKAGEADLENSMALFKQALTIDPNFGEAYAALGTSYYFLSNLHKPPQETIPLATSYSRTALRHDPNLSEAYAVLGSAAFDFHYNFPLAEEYIQKAIELKPSLAHIHLIYAYYLTAMGHYEKSMDQFNLAKNLDPFSVLVIREGPFIHIIGRDFDAALVAGQETLKLDPNEPLSHSYIGLAYALKALGSEMGKEGLMAQAIQSSIAASQLDNAPPVVLANLAYVYALNGQVKEAEAEIAKLNKLLETHHICLYEFAYIYAALKRNDKAFEYLEKAWTKQHYCVPFTREDPRLENLHTDPRFNDYLKKVGLEPL